LARAKRRAARGKFGRSGEAEQSKSETEVQIEHLNVVSQALTRERRKTIAVEHILCKVSF
jgi:hypothetical protein